MSLPFPRSTALAQVPSVPPPAPPLEGLPPEAIYGGGAALALLVVVVAARLLRKKKAPTPGAQAPTLPAETPALKVELPPSAEEAARRAEAEQARAEAEALAEQRRALRTQAQTATGREDAARLTAEAQALKAKEEEAKKLEYRARKAAEGEERERHRREQEEAARLAAEAADQARAEAQARAQALREEEQKKIAAQSGQTLARGLDKTRNQGFLSKLSHFFGGAPQAVDEAVLGQLEEVLFTADIGVRTASHLVEVAREKVKRNELASADKIKEVIRREVERIVDLAPAQTLAGGGPPHVMMVVGVNGAGKTTTIGKLAAKAGAQGRKVVLAAGDTFRAAAAEQLDVWAERAGAELIKGKEDSDPSAVVFDAVRRAREGGASLVIADTAGRLHTKAPLMEELKKVRRVMDKALAGAPHEVLLVLDATNGQNAIAQAKQFHEAVGVTSIALTKLDGTAKGGVIIGICDELKIPVAWVGVGEKVEDLRPFDSKEFVSALFD